MKKNIICCEFCHNEIEEGDDRLTVTTTTGHDPIFISERRDGEFVQIQIKPADVDFCSIDCFARHVQVELGRAARNAFRENG